MSEFGVIKRRGLCRLGRVYFPDFPRDTSIAPAIELTQSLEPAERRELAVLLVFAAFVPQWLVRVLFLCEDEDRTGALWRMLAPIQFQLKGLCALVYFAARDGAEGDRDG